MSRELDTSALYDEHVDFVWRMLSRLGVATAELEDAVQEVFLTLHRRRAEFRAASSVKTWVAGIAVHVAKDHRRSGRRLAQGIDRLQAEPLASDRAGPHESAEAAAALRVALTMLEALDEDQRTVFVLTEWEGLAAHEIAEITGTNANTVASRLRRARAHFNELLLAFQRKEGAL